MPPVAETTSPGNPSDSPYSVTLDVERIALAAGTEQKFRFTIVAQHIDNREVLPGGGTFKVCRQKNGRKPLVLFSVRVPSPIKRSVLQNLEMKFMGEVVVQGPMPVAHNPDDCFILSWDAPPGGDAINPLIYGHPIAAFR
jgi:hypothetical protein